MNAASARVAYMAGGETSGSTGPVPSAKQRIAAFASLASTEITTHDEKILPELAATLKPGTTVYVAHTPKATFEEVVAVSLAVQAAGLQACPHLVARRLPGEAQVRDGLRRLAGVGIEQALLVAGDRDEPVGPYHHTLDVIASDVLIDSGLRRLGVAGHPDGHPHASEQQLWDALRFKQGFGERSGIQVHVATQFGFDPRGLNNWAAQFAQNGIDLPVHAGVAGPTSFTKLLKFAMQCGVGASLQAAMKNVKSFSSVARQSMTPEGILPQLVELGGGTERSRISQPHIFAFGGAVATANWMRAVIEGDFDVRADGSISLTR